MNLNKNKEQWETGELVTVGTTILPINVTNSEP